MVEVTPELREAADGYLTLLDRGQNEEVWHRSAIIFKESVTLDAWIKQVERLKAAGQGENQNAERCNWAARSSESPTG